MVKDAPHRLDALARAKAKVGRSNVVGMCAHEVIVNILGIPAPWKWGGSGRAYAINYFLGSQKVVRTSDPAKIPAGAVVIWGPRPGATTAGGKAGHIAIGAGDGYTYSTDLPVSGRWGKVKIADVTRLWGKPLVGYVLVDGMGYNVAPPSVAPPAPKVKPPRWFGIDYRNLAGFDTVRGAKTLEDRIPDLVKDIAYVGRDIVCIVELPNPQVRNVTTRLAMVGYKHAGGDLGRHIFVRSNATVGASKMFDLTPRLHGDTKQGVGVIVRPTNDNAVAVCTAQLENEDTSGKTQVGQAGNLIDQFEAWCDGKGIPDHRRFYAIDTNSDNLVRALFESRDYVDAFDVAYSAENAVWRSIAKWFGKPTVGKRIDLIAVRRGRPVRRARLRTTTSDLSDHFDQFIDVGSL